jgi:dimethylglycine dehydrogenase
VDFDKGDFVGRAGLLAWQERGFANRYVTLEVHGVTDTDARGSEPIYDRDQLVGRCTSGGFGWRVGRSLALGFVRIDLGEVGTKLGIDILGERHDATVIAHSPFDPRNERLRG